MWWAMRSCSICGCCLPGIFIALIIYPFMASDSCSVYMLTGSNIAALINPPGSKLSTNTSLGGCRMNSSFHPQLSCLFKSLWRLSTKKSSKLCIIDPLCCESTHNRWLPSTKGQKCREYIYVMISNVPQNNGNVPKTMALEKVVFFNLQYYLEK